MYNEGDKTHFQQVLENCNIRRCWDEVCQKADLKKRRADIEEFNKYNNNRYTLFVYSVTNRNASIHLTRWKKMLIW